MALSNARAVSVGETPYPHESAAIRFAREALPDRDPFHLWALIDLLDPSTGRQLELDLLVIGYSAIYLIEIKSGPGLYTGDAIDWWWTPPGGEPRWMDNPRRLTQRKAQILKSRLTAKLPHDLRAPWIEPLVFLANTDTTLRLSEGGRAGVVTQAELARAITHHEFPGGPAVWSQSPIDRPTLRAVVKGFEQIGIRRRKGKLFVGPYELGAILDETDSFQDREATHRDIKSQKRRARTYLVPEQSSVERRQQLRRAADHEAQLLYEVREHPGILRFTEYVTDAPLGPTVLLDAFEGGIPLDAFLRENPGLAFSERIGLIEEVGRALDFCHKKEVVHGALSPSAVLVRRRSGPFASGGGSPSLETRLFDFQLGRGHEIEATSHWSALATEAWSIYQAPELRDDPGLRSPQSDLFSLGALAHLILTGQPPGATIVDVAARLAQHRHLDPRLVTDTVPDEVADLVAMATDVALVSRADDVGEWVELLIERATTPTASAEPEISPLEARKGDRLGDLEVIKVLGHGASSRVLEVARPDRRQFALKVSIGPDQDERLAVEAALLARLRHPRIVVLEGTPTFGGRPCLLLSLAGDRTLHRLLADEGTVSLDYGQRYGVDLLDALTCLEEAEVLHKDLKPANLGVGTTRRQASGLTLFDFSLAGSAADLLGVGTAAYRDPFLPARGRWDHAADRYSAAVVLHELLTGQRPRLTAPSEDPTATVQVSAERFDPAARTALAAFFARALSRDAATRFPSAVEMRRAWERAFEIERRPAAATSTAARDALDRPELTDEAIAAIAADTPIAALPLTGRAKNALDRAGVLRAADLLTLPRNRLSGIRGVGRLVADEIHQLRERLADRALPASGAPFFAGYHGEDQLLITALVRADAELLADAGVRTLSHLAAAPAGQLEALADRGLDLAAVRARLTEENSAADERDRPTTLTGWIAALLSPTKKNLQHVRALYGLAGPLVGQTGLGPREVAAALGITPPAIYIALTKARDTWAAHPAMPLLIARLRDRVTAAGGAAPLARVAAELLAELPHEPGEGAADPALLMFALIRAAAEVDKEDPAGLGLARLHDVLWLVASDDIADAARRLGRIADELAGRDVLAGPAECARALAAAAEDSPLAALPAERLVTLAAAAAERAEVSSRLELYPRGMAARRALELSAAVLGPGKPMELLEKVAARYPDAEPLPDRPELDELLASYDLHWDAAEAAYSRRGASPPTSFDTRHVSHPRVAAEPSQPRVLSAREIVVADFDDRIRAALERRALLVLGVAADQAPVAARALGARHRLVPISFDRLFADELARQMKSRGVAWDSVTAADAEGPTGEAWPLLVGLARDVATAIAGRLLPPRKPLFLVDPGLIDRYQLTDFLRALGAAAARDDADAILVLVPDQGGGTPAIGGRTPVPGLLPGQTTWIDPGWLKEARV